MVIGKNVRIIWRDENYGRISDAQSCRYEVDPYPSDTERAKIARIFRKIGFDIHPQRQCWMAEYKPSDTCVKLVEALEGAGYSVENFGAVPDALLPDRTFGV